MNITKEQIKALKPCADGYEWFLKNGSADLKTTLLSVDEVNPEWAKWLYTNLMTTAQRRLITVFAAEQVLPIFEKKFPDDKRPRNAIAAAKASIENDTPENRARAANAAAAAYAAVDAAAYAANAANAANAAAAANAANAAAYAADAACAAAANAAYAAYAAYAANAAYAAYAANAAAYAADAANAAADAAAYAADAARKEMQGRIILEAVRILDESER